MWTKILPTIVHVEKILHIQSYHKDGRKISPQEQQEKVGGKYEEWA
jgi:hypothetical protein